MHAPITDPEILAFIEEVDRLTPPGTADQSIAEQRALYDTMAAHFRAARPVGLPVVDLDIAGVPCRRYGQEAAPHALFFHGGGFVVGGLDSHDDVAAEIAARTGCCVTAVDYRLAPEHLHPAAFDDALAVTNAAKGPIILVGDSAGGALAASTAWTLRGTGRVAGQVLLYPTLGGLALDLPSYRECADAPLLSTDDIRVYSAIRGGEAGSDPTQHVLAAMTYTGMAPAFISAAGVDPLRDDGAEYARRLREAGVQADVVIEEQLPHMWLRARHRSARAARAFDRAVAAVAGFAAPVNAR
ncbi:alpha/beta hydrolase fold domain-containing protein [Rhodobacteraceae bacterium NNCM2]|nr:alpha/beta hydrolase fold domain-containing protein [Coraliihabitans acroporae]